CRPGLCRTRLLFAPAVSFDTQTANGFQDGFVWSGHDRPTARRAAADRRPARDTALPLDGRLTPYLCAAGADGRIRLPSGSVVAGRREPSVGRRQLPAFCAGRSGYQRTRPVPGPGTNVVHRWVAGRSRLVASTRRALARGCAIERVAKR